VAFYHLIDSAGLQFVNANASNPNPIHSDVQTRQREQQHLNILNLAGLMCIKTSQKMKGIDIRTGTAQIIPQRKSTIHVYNELSDT
jgi:hypothetical protein